MGQRIDEYFYFAYRLRGAGGLVQVVLFCFHICVCLFIYFFYFTQYFFFDFLKIVKKLWHGTSAHFWVKSAPQVKLSPFLAHEILLEHLKEDILWEQFVIISCYYWVFFSKIQGKDLKVQSISVLLFVAKGTYL